MIHLEHDKSMYGINISKNKKVNKNKMESSKIFNCPKCARVFFMVDGEHIKYRKYKRLSKTKPVFGKWKLIDFSDKENINPNSL